MNASEAHSEVQRGETEPKLAAPGAGVPLHQRMVMRFYLKPFVANRSVWEENSESFQRTFRKILERADALPLEQVQKPVLIPPMIGIEDSSRYWSVSMAIDHVTIVSRAISQVVQLLSQGEIPPGKADPAKVKPPRTRPYSVVRKEYEAFASEEFPRLLPSLINRESRTKFFHPWLGPMNARAWYWLLVSHQGLHYKQIKLIGKGLNSPENPTRSPL